MGMKYGTVPGIDKKVSRLVQGAGRAAGMGEQDGFALLDAVREKGCTVYDTGRVYGDTDRFLGAWIRSTGIRDEVVILGKGAHHSGDRQRVTPEDIREDVDKSLSEMGVDHIDLYILHRDDPSVPVGPIVETLNTLAKEGKIGVFGGSNWTPERLAEANAYAAEKGLTPLRVSNPNYSLAEQVEEPWTNCISISGPQGEAAREWYAREQMPVFSWSSLAGGFWSGRITRENKDEKAAEMKLVSRCYYSEANFERLDRAGALAARKGVTVPQIALAFVMNQPLNLFALVGCATGEEFQANVDALDLVLTPQELAWLDLKADNPA